VLGIPERFTVFDEAHKEVAAGAFGESKELPQGHYHFAAAFAGRQFEREFWINPNGTTTVTFDATQAKDAAGTAVAAPAAPSTPAAPAAQPTARFCTHCGAPLKPDAKFCTSCGTKVGG